MEVAAGRSGDATVSSGSRARLNLALYVVVLLLACACVVGGVMSWKAYGERADDAEAQERYGDVLAAARAEAEALVNIRYDDAEAGVAKVAEGATGKFGEQYSTASESVIKVMRQNESVSEGEVLWAGVVDVDPDSATVIVATEGTVANKQTGGKPVSRYFSMKLSLVREGGRWLTSNLEFVS